MARYRHARIPIGGLDIYPYTWVQARVEDLLSRRDRISDEVHYNRATRSAGWYAEKEHLWSISSTARQRRIQNIVRLLGNYQYGATNSLNRSYRIEGVFWLYSVVTGRTILSSTSSPVVLFSRGIGVQHWVWSGRFLHRCLCWQYTRLYLAWF